MKLLVVGGGGREHALVWKLKQSGRVEAIHCVPGNAGIDDIATCHDMSVDDVSGLIRLCASLQIDLVVVGPELPLTLGLVDELDKAGIKAFGPSRDAAILEGSKVFMKNLCKKYDIPTARYERFTDVVAATTYLESFEGNDVVIKADGLAAGKGVIIPQSKEEARAAVKMMLEEQKFGRASEEIVIEEFLDGVEASFFALTDGEHILPFGTAEDHKRAYDQDKGPNTGGMGAFSPSPLIDAKMQQKVISNILEPTLNGLKAEGISYKGVLYAGLMIVDGEPKLLEYNVRFGDPECQVLMMRLESDLVDILEAVCDQKIIDIKDGVKWSEQTATTVVMAAKGYPESYNKGTVIKGLESVQPKADEIVFHAGTARNASQEFVNIGGRVLNVTVIGSGLSEARQKAYAMIEKIDWPEGFYRSDIGLKQLREDVA